MSDKPFTGTIPIPKYIITSAKGEEAPYPTLAEWKGKKARFILYNGSANGSATTLYTVPQGKVVYLTSILLSALDIAGHNFFSMEILSAAGIQYVLILLSNTTASTIAPLVLPCPLPVYTGNIITVRSANVNCLAQLTVTGWEEDILSA